MADSDLLIEWGDPPPLERAKPPRYPWARVVAELRTRPGQWACVDDQSNITLSTRVNRGESWWGPPGTFEAVRRTVDGRMRTWVRYIPPTDPPAADGG